MSNSRDLSLHLRELLQHNQFAAMLVFNWAKDARFPSSWKEEEAVGEVRITNVETSDNDQEFLVTTSDRRRFRVIVSSIDA